MRQRLRNPLIPVVLAGLVAASVVFAANVDIMHGAFGAHSTRAASRPKSHPTHVLPVSRSSARQSDQSGHDASGPVVTLQGNELTSNIHLSFTASGFLPGEMVAVTVDGASREAEAQLAPTTAGANGQVGPVSADIPTSLGPGVHELTLSGLTSQRKATAAFHFTRLPPRLTLETYSAKPGQTIGFASDGFIPHEQVTLTLLSTSMRQVHVSLITVAASAGGDITGRMNTPLLPAGTYTIITIGHQSQTSISIGFTIQRFTPWVVLDHYSVAPGIAVGFTGQDFAPGEQVLIYLNTRVGDPVAQVMADTSGQFNVSAAWTPNSASDVGGKATQTTLIFVGQWSGASATAQLTVQPGHVR